MQLNKGGIMVLNDEQVEDIITNFLFDNDFVDDFTYKDYEDVKYVYNKIKYSRQQINKSYDELESLITLITQGVGSGESLETLIETHLDSKGTFSFEVFLGEGQRDKIDNILLDYGLSSDIFQGMQWVSDFHSGPIQTASGIVTVDYEVDTSYPGSPIPKTLEVKLNGESIYKWENEGDVNYAKEYKRKMELLQQKNAEKMMLDINWLSSADKEYNKYMNKLEKAQKTYKSEIKEVERDVKNLKEDQPLLEQFVDSRGIVRWRNVYTKKIHKAPSTEIIRHES